MIFNVTVTTRLQYTRTMEVFAVNELDAIGEAEHKAENETLEDAIQLGDWSHEVYEVEEIEG